MEVIATGIVATLGKGLMAKAVGDVVTDIYGNIKGVVKHPHLRSVMEELDLEAQLEIVEALIKEISQSWELEKRQAALTTAATTTTSNATFINESPQVAVAEMIDAQMQKLDELKDLKELKEIKEIDNSPVTICLKNLLSIVEQIRTEMEKINQEIEFHNTRWLANWREPNYSKQIENLRKYKKVLDSRLDMLIKILSISKTTTSNAGNDRQVQ
eukprot:TRINITY_DN4139_c0_g1_i1.p1 TRINITY_DN4139_c0_g1~~TRINITY_DN4139_c0_g1_i1.p1  ORF type:complete len:232 (+),score=81.23 TRINITY_DN4139_c0_g1_i1:56-697(+)